MKRKIILNSVEEFNRALEDYRQKGEYMKKITLCLAFPYTEKPQEIEAYGLNLLVTGMAHLKITGCPATVKIKDNSEVEIYEERSVNRIKVSVSDDATLHSFGHIFIKAKKQSFVHATGGYIKAFGKSFINANYDADVIAYDHATVNLGGNARGDFHDHVTAFLSGDSFATTDDFVSVVANHNSTVKAGGLSSVRVLDNAEALLYHKSGVSAHGNSRVFLYDYSHAEAYDESVLRMLDISTAVLYDTSSAVCHDMSVVKCFENSKAELYGNAKADLYDSALAYAYEFSQILLLGGTGVKAFDRSTVKTTSAPSSQILLYGEARVCPVDEIPFMADGKDSLYPYLKRYALLPDNYGSTTKAEEDGTLMTMYLPVQKLPDGGYASLSDMSVTYRIGEKLDRNMLPEDGLLVMSLPECMSFYSPAAEEEGQDFAILAVATKICDLSMLAGRPRTFCAEIIKELDMDRDGGVYGKFISRKKLPRKEE